MLLFLIGIPIFYIGEAIHRDSDVRVEGMLWSHPIPNYVILSAKFLSTLLLVFGLISFGRSHSNRHSDLQGQHTAGTVGVSE